MVQRASLSFCRFFAGFLSHAAGVSPRFTVSFSSRLLRCFKTGTIVASTIWPPRAMLQSIATRIEPLKGFYPAESYHQDYLAYHSNNLYIVYNDLPKLEALKRLFPESYRAEPKPVAAQRPPL